eukprot:scaffold179283_cov40-Prasinocladus_malaysianus.AAC.1
MGGSHAPQLLRPWLADLMNASVLPQKRAVPSYERIYAAVISAALAAMPTLVVVEGLQWLDKSSWNILWALDISNPPKPEVNGGKL